MQGCAFNFPCRTTFLGGLLPCPRFSHIHHVRLLVSASPNQPVSSVFLSQQTSTSPQTNQRTGRLMMGAVANCSQHLPPPSHVSLCCRCVLAQCHCVENALCRVKQQHSPIDFQSADPTLVNERTAKKQEHSQATEGTYGEREREAASIVQLPGRKLTTGSAQQQLFP